MKTISSRLLLSAVALLVAVSSSFAQQASGAPKGPASKIYVADATGEGQIESGTKTYAIKQSTAFIATGSVIETKAKAHNTIVYSNGTGMFVDENTHVEIERFVQQPFQARKDGTLDSSREPSVSQSNILITQGVVGICTNELLAGSTMTYSTPHATVLIRGGKLVIEVLPDETRVDLLEGDVTVRVAGTNEGGQVLHAGERAVVRASAPGSELTITLMPIPDDARKKDEQRVAAACAGRKAVTFEALGLPVGENSDEAAGAGEEIVARPTVPNPPPSNVVVSPDRLPGT